MKKLISLALLTVLILLICSCTTTDGGTIFSKKENVDIFPNSEIPNEVFINAYNGYLRYTDGNYRIFDNYRTYLPAEKIFIMQTLSDNAALAHVAYQHYDYIDGYKDRYDNLVLLVGESDAYYYDDMVISIKANEEVKQIGVYTYTTVEEKQKTVPIVYIVR